MLMLPIKKWGRKFTSEEYREVAGFNDFAVGLLDYSFIIVDSILIKKRFFMEKRDKPSHHAAPLVQVHSAEQFGFEFGEEAVIEL